MIYISDSHKPIRYLISAFQGNRLHHAFLFTGIEGVGRFNAAIQFSMVCNCENRSDLTESCSECPTCRRIYTNQHPDMIRIQPEGTSIKISQIRNLRKKLSYKPVDADTRFVFVIKANLMTIESANALLKILEEPPDCTVFILIVENQNDVLQTISSRCQQIRFSPCEETTIVADLLKTNDINPDTARLIAGLSFGSFIRASLYLKKKWMTKRSYILSRLEKLDQMSSGFRLCFAEQLSKKKDDIPVILDIIMSWFRDILIYRYCPERIINKDYQQSIYDHAVKYSREAVIQKIEQIQIVQKDIAANLNIRLALDQLILVQL